MAQDDVRELYKLHREGADKYTYFLLAVAASAVAFAIQKTESATFTWWLVPMGFAVLSFGLSFVFGVLTLIRVNAAIGANYQLLQLHAGLHQDQPSMPDELQAAKTGVARGIAHSSTRAKKYTDRQFWWLIAGAVFFVAWHVLQIYLRTAGAAVVVVY